MMFRKTPVVLLVEDNPDDIYFIRTVLEESQTPKKLYVARDGQEALAFLRREDVHEKAPRPNLILLDLKLPKLSGLEVLEQIKADDDLRAIPVVVLTTSDADEDMLASYDRFATSVITKPHDLKAFKAVMKQIEHFWLKTVQLPRQR